MYLSTMEVFTKGQHFIVPIALDSHAIIRLRARDKHIWTIVTKMIVDEVNRNARKQNV